MPGEVFREGGIIVTMHVERGGRHHEPHCHVRWQHGEASVRLPDLVVLDGTGARSTRARCAPATP